MGNKNSRAHGLQIGMAWKETCVMSERVKLVNEYLSGEYGISELALEYEVSRKTVYKWIGPALLLTVGGAALADGSRAPRTHPNAVALELERALLELKARRPLWGAPKLRHKLLEQFGPERCPAESTVSELLRRHGLSRVGRRRRRAVPSEQPFGHCLGANEVWCADFKGWFRTGDGKKCTPLTISDAYSRYLLCCQGLDGETGVVTAQPLFIATFREYGMPRQRSGPTTGRPFATTGLAGLELAGGVVGPLMGIGLERIEPRSAAAKWPSRADASDTQRGHGQAAAAPVCGCSKKAFDEFRQEYNQERPHEALEQRVPAKIYGPSARPYPERLPDQGALIPTSGKKRSWSAKLAK